MKNGKIIKICNQKFIYLNYSPNTAKTYIHYIELFLVSIGDRQVIHLSYLSLVRKGASIKNDRGYDYIPKTAGGFRWESKKL